MLEENTQKIPYRDFLENFKKTLKKVFCHQDDLGKIDQSKGFPQSVFEEIMNQVPLSVAIPEEYGGRGIKVSECLGILEAASYESLSLSLTFGINIALFLEPVAKYANPKLRERIFHRFLNEKNMGGLMITEPDFGSDALNMETFHVSRNGNTHIKGDKHWQGLTGKADYWLVACRKKLNNDFLARDIDFFIVDNHHPDQKISVKEYYNSAGLYTIPYGMNTLDIKVPENQKLEATTTGIKLMLDLLHRSRMQFPGMAVGFVKRMLDEAIIHCKKRIVKGKNLLVLDKVKEQISKIQSAFTICSAMCVHSSKSSGIEHELEMRQIEANTMKCIVTELMQESSQTLVQLSGASGYKQENIGARGIMDSKAFMIFEGSNEMLYAQISESFIKLMKRSKIRNLISFFKKYDLTKKSCNLFDDILNFNLNMELPQRKMIDLGKIIGRVISADFVINLELKGFRKDLINQCLISLKKEVTDYVSSLSFKESTDLVLNYEEGSTWFNYA